MFNKSYTIGRAFGIPIKVHSSLLILILLGGLLPGIGPLGAIFLAVGIFGSVALHELGHSWVAMKKGSYVQEILLSPLGGAAKMMNIPSHPKDEILVALAGPAVSLALAVIFTLLYMQTFFDLFVWVAGINTTLLLFNVLPVFPMDGGRVLRAILSIKYGRLEGTRKAVTIGKYFCYAFIIIGIINLKQYFMLAIIGFYIQRAGKIEYAMVRQEYQADPRRGQREDRIDVEVSPPPYEENKKSKWFRW